jgi:hypothetical protein
MGGPFSKIYAHDIRDWALHYRRCHPYLIHRNSILRGSWWNLHCELKLTNSPRFEPAPQAAADPFYQFLKWNWRWHQPPAAIVFYFWGKGLGGLGRLCQGAVGRHYLLADWLVSAQWKRSKLAPAWECGARLQCAWFWADHNGIRLARPRPRIIWLGLAWAYVAIACFWLRAILFLTKLGSAH